MKKRFGRPTFDHKPQLCESCQNYAGGKNNQCLWSGRGADGKVRFEPVPGWTARKVPYVSGRIKEDFTYEISGCPLYIPDNCRDVGVMERVKRNGS